MMAFVLRRSLLPMIKRAHMRKPFQQWRYVIQQEHAKAIDLQKHMEQWRTSTTNSDSARSMDSRSSISDHSQYHMTRFSTSSSIGEEIGSRIQTMTKRSDDDTFFFIRAIKNDEAYLLSNTDIVFKK